RILYSSNLDSIFWRVTSELSFSSTENSFTFDIVTSIIIYRICFDSRFKDRKITKFFLQNLKKQVHRELLTFEVTDIRDHQPVIGIEEFMVFDIGRDKELSPSC